MPTPFKSSFPSVWPMAGIGMLLALVGCGGGGPDTPASTLDSAVGAWKDNTSTRPTRAVMVLPSGAFWAFYDGTGGIAGFDQGSARATGTTLQADTMQYFNGFNAYAVALTAQMGSTSLSGSRNWSTGSNSFLLTRMLPSDFVSTQAQVSDLQGSWSGTLSGVGANVLVPSNSTGAFSGTSGSNGCTFTGTLTPQANAYAYDVRLSFDNSLQCSEPGTSTTGVAMVYKTNNGTQKQLFMAVQSDRDRTKGWLFAATR